MKKLLVLPLLLLFTATGARSQDQSSLLTQGNLNAVADFARTPFATNAAQSSLNGTFASLAVPETSLAALSFSVPTPAVSAAPASTFAAPAMPSSSATLADPAATPPTPSRNYEERPYSWEIGIGFALVRFRSSRFYATAPGVYSALAYYFSDWIAIEGNVTSAFAPTIFQHDHVKFLGYTVGPKFTFARRRYEPWVHILVGGMHILPQTADGGQNGFELQTGVGVDYNFNPRLSGRILLDYLGTPAFGQYQNSAEGAAALVFHF
jgi:hypothetical protein